MIDSMDIAFLLVDTSTTNLFVPNVTRLISSIINPLIEKNYDIRLALSKFKSDKNSSMSISHAFTQSILCFKENLSANQTNVGHETISICDILRAAVDFEWRTTNAESCHENIVFLITDSFPCRYSVNLSKSHDTDAPCACDDLWKISTDFVNANLTLMVVGVGDLVSICDNLYADIAQNTGGEYIPLTNAVRVLQMVLESVIFHGDTLSQSLRHIRPEEFEKDSSYYFSKLSKRNQSGMKHCQVMAQKGVWLLNHCHQIR